MSYLAITCQVKGYRNYYLFSFQAVQENEDDSAEISSAGEISELLGDKEHLYPKILYLVIADSAYSEGNHVLHCFLRSYKILYTIPAANSLASLKPGNVYGAVWQLRLKYTLQKVP